MLSPDPPSVHIDAAPLVPHHFHPSDGTEPRPNQTVRRLPRCRGRSARRFMRFGGATLRLMLIGTILSQLGTYLTRRYYKRSLGNLSIRLDASNFGICDMIKDKISAATSALRSNVSSSLRRLSSVRECPVQRMESDVFPVFASVGPFLGAYGTTDSALPIAIPGKNMSTWCLILHRCMSKADNVCSSRKGPAAMLTIPHPHCEATIESPAASNK